MATIVVGNTHLLLRTGCWEERSFVREGEPAGTMADMQKDRKEQKHHGVYWRGELYVHCQNDFFWRISASNGKYHVIKPPVGIESNGNTESSGHTAEWVLKHQNNIEPLLSSPDYHQRDRGPWILEDTR